MKFNYGKLRGRIREKFGSEKAFASALGVSKATISHAFARTKTLKDIEIIEWCRVLDIKAKEIPEYFFVFEVCES